ncbi:MAG TPA: 50S ribosomal protein L10, partial [Patescibacteria group bacterium]|nr:50S ribosomal protein L10 [Patescibacteria group bacterium]
MAKNKIQKQEIVRDLEEKIKKSKSIILTSFDGLGVKDNEELRNSLRQENGEYYVSKKTLLDLALKSNKINDLDVKGLDGKVAVVFAYEDQVSPAKVIFNFRKNNEGKIDFLGGVLDGKVISKEEVENLATLPSRSELLAKMVGSLNAPVSGLVNVLAGNLRALVTALKAIAD